MVLAVRCMTVMWGDEVWQPVFDTMVPGTMTSAVWTDAVPEAWLQR
jgi:hypothetical protein